MFRNKRFDLVEKIVQMDVRQYVCSDGDTYLYEHQAEDHENWLWRDKVEKTLTKMKLELPHPLNKFISKEWVLIGNDEQREYLFLKCLSNNSYINDKHIYNESPENFKHLIRLGDWVAVQVFLDSEDEEVSGLISLRYVHKIMSNTLGKIDGFTVEGMF